MKNKKKLQYVEAMVREYEDNPKEGFIEIARLLGIHKEPEPEPEFEPGDKVGVDYPVLDYEFHVDALEGHGGLKGQIKVSAWVEPQDIEKI